MNKDRERVRSPHDDFSAHGISVRRCLVHKWACAGDHRAIDMLRVDTGDESWYVFGLEVCLQLCCQGRCGTRPVDCPQGRRDGLSHHPPSRSFIAKQVAPSSRTRFLPTGVDAIGR
jgi:hypothetical protein